MRNYYKVIIVDDDKIVQFIHRKLLQKNNISVERIFENGRKVLNYIQSKETADFLILLDLNMPVMDGWTFLEEIKKSPKMNDLKIVVVSSSIINSEKVKARKYLQVKGIFEKPMTIDSIEKIKKFLKHLGEIKLLNPVIMSHFFLQMINQIV